jgi:hypothetical protein
MNKPTKEKMKEWAWGIAQDFFYSDDECEVPWEPFEHFNDDELLEQVKQLAETIFNAMVRARGDGDESQ